MNLLCCEIDEIVSYYIFDIVYQYLTDIWTVGTVQSET